MHRNESIQIRKKVYIMKKLNLIATLLGATVASSAAFAEKPNTYVFVDGLYSNFVTDVGDESEVDPARTTTPTNNWSIDPSKPVFSKGDVSDPDGGVRLGGGLDFAENWGIEVSLSLFGEGTDTLDNNTNGDIELATRARTFSVDFLRYFDLTDWLSLYGKAGLDAWTVDIRAKQTGKDTDRDRDSGYMPSIAIGAKMDIGDAWLIRAELSYRVYTAEFSQYQTKNNPVQPVPEGELDALGRYETLEVDVKLTTFSIGAAYRF
jgi:opacity protein-like surface antigen